MTRHWGCVPGVPLEKLQSRIRMASPRRQEDSCGRNPEGMARLLSVNVGLPRDIVPADSNPLVCGSQPASDVVIDL